MNLDAYDFRAAVEFSAASPNSPAVEFGPGGIVGVNYRFPSVDTKRIGQETSDVLVGTYLAVEGPNPLRSGEAGTIRGFTLTSEILPLVAEGDPIEIFHCGRRIGAGAVIEVISPK